jgi:hypothetical protein
MVDGLPGREVVRQQAPSATTAAHDVEDGVEDLAQGMDPRASFGFWGREVGLYTGPFGIGEVGLVCFSQHARYSTEQPHQSPFSDGFYSLSGSTADVKPYVLQKSTGTHYLVLRRNIETWNSTTNTEVSNPEVSVTVNLASPARRVLVYKPHSSAMPVADHAGPTSSVNVSVPDHPVVLEIEH